MAAGRISLLNTVRFRRSAEGTPSIWAAAEEMAHNLYAQLRAAESCATLLICIQPTCADDAMEGVLNRLRRACGVEDGKGNTQKDQA